MKPNKIAILNSVYKFGSTGRICFEMASFFVDKGIETRVYYGRGKRQQDGIGFKFSSPISIFFHGICARLFDSDSLSSKLATKRLIKMLEDYNPDTLIINNIHGYYININILFRYIIQKKMNVYYIFHDCWPITGHCAYFDFSGCVKYKTGCNTCPNIHSYPKSFFFDNSKKNYLRKKFLLNSVSNLHIVCPSFWMKSVVEQSFLRHSNIVVINNGIDTSIFSKKQSNFRKTYSLGDKKIILCVANVWDERKGIDDVLQLTKYLKEDEVIVLVGKIKKKVDLRNNKIVYIKHTNSIVQLSEIYSSSDVFFNPTYEDTFSNVNMEALSCKLPVICYKTGGAYEMVDESFVVAKGSLCEAYSIIEKVLLNQKKYNFQNSKTFDKELTYNNYYKLICNSDE